MDSLKSEKYILSGVLLLFLAGLVAGMSGTITTSGSFGAAQDSNKSISLNNNGWKAISTGNGSFVAIFEQSSGTYNVSKYSRSGGVQSSTTVSLSNSPSEIAYNEDNGDVAVATQGRAVLFDSSLNKQWEFSNPYSKSVIIGFHSSGDVLYGMRDTCTGADSGSATAWDARLIRIDRSGGSSAFDTCVTDSSNEGQPSSVLGKDNGEIFYISDYSDSATSSWGDGAKVRVLDGSGNELHETAQPAVNSNKDGLGSTHLTDTGRVFAAGTIKDDHIWTARFYAENASLIDENRNYGIGRRVNDVDKDGQHMVASGWNSNSEYWAAKINTAQHSTDWVYNFDSASTTIREGHVSAGNGYYTFTLDDWDSTEVDVLTYSSNSQPSISSVSTTPSTWTSGDTVDVEVEASDDGSITTVSASLWKDGGKKVSDFSLSGSGGTWSAEDVFEVNRSDVFYNLSVTVEDDQGAVTTSWINKSVVSTSLTWNDNSGNEDGFNIYTNVTGSFQKVQATGADATSYTYSSSQVNFGDSRCFQVAAYNNYGESGPAEGCFVP